MKPLAGLLALLILALPAGAVARDRDHDGLPDGWERQHGLSTKAAGTQADPDRDGVDNRNEHREGTDPRKRDSDGNGRADGREDADRDGLANAAEDATGNDPIDADSDDDGLRDGREQAGVVASFAGGVLELKLASGRTASGTVDELADVSCTTEARLEHGQHGSARRGLRSGRRGRGRGPGKQAHRHGRAAQAPEGEELGEDDGLGEDDTGSDDDQNLGDDESGDDGLEDEDWDDESVDDEDVWEDEPATGGACRARLRPGARVHEAEIEDGAVLAIVLVR